MLALPGMALLLLATHTPYINMAIHDPEATILGYISEVLNPEECHELYLQLAILPKDIKQPSAEKDLFPPSQWQVISNMDQCKDSLSQWLKMQRGAVNWDHLARALRQIGRPDISRELKKSLNKNRSLEPKWSQEENQTKGLPTSVLVVKEKVPFRRSCQSPTQKHQRSLLMEKGQGLMASFLKFFQLLSHNPTLQQYIGPATQLLITSLLTGLILWLILVCYINCWNLCQGLFTNGSHHGGTPARQNFIVNWNHSWSEDSLDDTEDLDTSAEDEWEETEEEPLPP